MIEFPPPAEQAKMLKNEGNEFFKEKNYQKAILSYTAGLKKKCGDQELNTVLLTNRAAAHFYLGRNCSFQHYIAYSTCIASTRDVHTL